MGEILDRHIWIGKGKGKCFFQKSSARQALSHLFRNTSGSSSVKRLFPFKHWNFRYFVHKEIINLVISIKLNDFYTWTQSCISDTEYDLKLNSSQYYIHKKCKNKNYLIDVQFLNYCKTYLPFFRCTVSTLAWFN